MLIGVLSVSYITYLLHIYNIQSEVICRYLCETFILDCYSYEEGDLCEAENGTYYLRQCYNYTYATAHNISGLADAALRRPPAEEYFT